MVRFSAQAANKRRNLDVPRAERSETTAVLLWSSRGARCGLRRDGDGPSGWRARARNSVGSSDWQALCDLEAELEAELRDEVTRSSERSRRKRAEGNGTSWDSPGVSSGPPTRARASTERPASSRSSPTASSSPGYRLRRQPRVWAPPGRRRLRCAPSSPGAVPSAATLALVDRTTGSCWTRVRRRPMLPRMEDLRKLGARPGGAPLCASARRWAETTRRSRPRSSSTTTRCTTSTCSTENGQDSGDGVGDPRWTRRRPSRSRRRGRRAELGARPVRPRALAGSVFQERRERLKRLSRDTSRAARPPFVAPPAPRPRAVLGFPARSGPRKENRSSSSIGGKSVFARSSEIPDATPRKASHTHASSAGIAGRAARKGEFSVAPDPGNRASPRREDPPPRAEGGANGDVFAAAVDATRSLFDAVERRVRDAVAREMETRHRLGGAQAVASPSLSRARSRGRRRPPRRRRRHRSNRRRTREDPPRLSTTSPERWRRRLRFPGSPVMGRPRSAR